MRCAHRRKWNQWIRVSARTERRIGAVLVCKRPLHRHKMFAVQREICCWYDMLTLRCHIRDVNTEKPQIAFMGQDRDLKAFVLSSCCKQVRRPCSACRTHDPLNRRKHAMLWRCVPKKRNGHSERARQDNGKNEPRCLHRCCTRASCSTP